MAIAIIIIVLVYKIISAITRVVNISKSLVSKCANSILFACVHGHPRNTTPWPKAGHSVLLGVLKVPTYQTTWPHLSRASQGGDGSEH